MSVSVTTTCMAPPSTGRGSALTSSQTRSLVRGRRKPITTLRTGRPVARARGPGWSAPGNEDPSSWMARPLPSNDVRPRISSALMSSISSAERFA